MNNEKMREALTEVVRLIDAAGLLNLSNGVQLGKTSWYVKMMDALSYAREALAEQSELSVPDKWKSVPMQATWQMEEAGSKAGGLGYRDVDNIDTDDAARVWEAMLAAAPEPPK